jgi:hypothetical protein
MREDGIQRGETRRKSGGRTDGRRQDGMMRGGKTREIKRGKSQIIEGKRMASEKILPRGSLSWITDVIPLEGRRRDGSVNDGASHSHWRSQPRMQSQRHHLSLYRHHHHHS